MPRMAPLAQRIGGGLSDLGDLLTSYNEDLNAHRHQQFQEQFAQQQMINNENYRIASLAGKNQAKPTKPPAEPKFANLQAYAAHLLSQGDTEGATKVLQLDAQYGTNPQRPETEKKWQQPPDVVSEAMADLAKANSAWDNTRYNTVPSSLTPKYAYSMPKPDPKQVLTESLDRGLRYASSLGHNLNRDSVFAAAGIPLANLAGAGNRYGATAHRPTTIGPKFGSRYAAPLAGSANLGVSEVASTQGQGDPVVNDILDQIAKEKARRGIQ